MTTNCIVPPKDSYKDRLYTTGAAGFVGYTHIQGESEDNKDFSLIIEQAKKCKPPVEIETGEIIGGFAHNQVFQLQDINELPIAFNIALYEQKAVIALLSLLHLGPTLPAFLSPNVAKVFFERL